MQNEQFDQSSIFEIEERKTIKGYPELRWTGKRPFKSTQFFPAQLKEIYGDPDQSGWLNKIFWGDNLQVMSHLLRDFRGKIDLIYIDPPFDSKADYKLKIKVKGVGDAISSGGFFEEKQYGDIWTNDEYLQFMFERLTLMRDLLSDTGQIYLHCDYHKGHHLRLLLDEVFGPSCFRNEIVWTYNGGGTPKKDYPRKHDTILRYSKTQNWVFNIEFRPYKENTQQVGKSSTYGKNGAEDLDLERGTPMTDWWDDINTVTGWNIEETGYPTQKPEMLVERIIKSSSNVGDLVFDCFMGSGTTPAVAMKLGRKFIGADINLGANQKTTKRLYGIIDSKDLLGKNYPGFEVYNVNNYDLFRNPIEARDLLIEALGIQPFSQRKVFDGELDGRNVKIMPVNRISTKADLKELIANLPYTSYDKKKSENPNSPVDYITLICMGHEPDLTAALKQEVSSYKIDIEVVDILSDKKELEFKREAKADVQFSNGLLSVNSFYPMNLMQKLSLQKEHVDEYRQLVESIMIDWNYDGQVFKPTTLDIPEKNEYVEGTYKAPLSHGKIKIKITDLLSESLEIEVE